MLTVDEAFRKFKSRLELNEKAQKNASNRHKEVRDYLATTFKIDRGRRPSGMLAPPTLEIPNVLVPDLPRLPDPVSDGSISDRRPPLLPIGSEPAKSVIYAFRQLFPPEHPKQFP